MTTQSHTINVSNWKFDGFTWFFAVLLPLLRPCTLECAHFVRWLVCPKVHPQQLMLLQRNSTKMYMSVQTFDQFWSQKSNTYKPVTPSNPHADQNTFTQGPSWATFANNILVVEGYFTSYLQCVWTFDNEWYSTKPSPSSSTHSQNSIITSRCIQFSILAAGTEFFYNIQQWCIEQSWGDLSCPWWQLLYFRGRWQILTMSICISNPDDTTIILAILLPLKRTQNTNQWPLKYSSNNIDFQPCNDCLELNHNYQENTTDINPPFPKGKSIAHYHIK